MSIGFALAALAACNGVERREQFVREYVRSVYDDTEFFRAYTPAERLPEVVSAREHMTREFVIVHQDRLLFGAYDYLLRFENGATGTLYVTERGGEVIQASIEVYPLLQAPL